MHFKQNYLSRTQWKYIQHIIHNTDAEQKERKVVNQILYNKYYGWAHSKAHVFKQFHRYKCRHININDLNVYSSLGLIKAIQNYNASFDFYNYADIYITSELYKGLTDLFPITTTPRSERTQKQLYPKKKTTRAQYIGKDEWWLATVTNEVARVIDEDEYKEYWIKIDTLEPFAKKVMYYKFDFYFTKIRSNKEIAKLMVCSEERVRKSVKQSALIMY